MNTNIYEQLEALYRASGYDAGALQADLALHLRVGCVFATPGSFIMGREISGGWYIHAAVGVGAIESFIRYMPHYLPYIGWERRGTGKVKWYRTDRLIRKLTRKETNEIAENASASVASSASK